MEESQLSNSIINRKFSKKKLPIFLTIKDFEKLNLNQKSKNSFIFAKKFGSKNNKYNKKINEIYETDYYQKNNLNTYRINNGLTSNSLLSKSISDNNSLLSSINNNSVDINFHNYLKEINPEKNSFEIYYKNHYKNNNLFGKSSLSSDNKKFSNSYSHINIKNDFNLDEDEKIMKPNPEPFPRKYNNYYCNSYDNRNLTIDINSAKKKYNKLPNLNIDISNSKNEITYIDQKLLFVLKNLGIENLYQVFINNGIYFKDLFLLNKEDLIEIKLPIGPRNRLLYFIILFNKSANNYDFEELYNFFKNNNENDKNINNTSNIKKNIIPHPNSNFYKKINKKNKKTLYMKTLYNRIKANNNIINKSIDRNNISLALSSSNSYKKNNLEESKYSSNEKIIDFIKKDISQNSIKKNNPEEISIDNIGNIKKINRSNSFNLKSFQNNDYSNNLISCNSLKKDINININNKKNKKFCPCPLPKRPLRINSVKSIKCIKNSIQNNENKNINKIRINKETFLDAIKRINHNYEIFKKNRKKNGNKVFNSFYEN